MTFSFLQWILAQLKLENAQLRSLRAYRALRELTIAEAQNTYP